MQTKAVPRHESLHFPGKNRSVRRFEFARRRCQWAPLCQITAALRERIAELMNCHKKQKAISRPLCSAAMGTGPARMRVGHAARRGGPKHQPRDLDLEATTNIVSKVSGSRTRPERYECRNGQTKKKVFRSFVAVCLTNE